MSYKLVKEDEKAFHLVHPDGRKFTVAKSAVSPEMHVKIQKMADGGITAPGTGLGTVANAIGDFAHMGSDPSGQNAAYLQNFIAKNSPDVQPSAQPSPQAGTPTMGPQLASNTDVDTSTDQTDNGSDEDEEETGQAATQQQTSGTEQPQQPSASQMASAISNAPVGAGPNQGNIIDQIMAASNQNIAKTADLQAEQAKAIYAAQAQNQIDQNKTTADFAIRYKEDDAQNAKLFNYIQDNPVDGNKFWTDKSVTGKMAAGIALILGGIGAGFSRGPNQALQTLQAMADKDLDAQKANLGRTQSLLSANLAKYRDDRQAELATRIQLNTNLQAQIAAASSKNGSQQAILNGRAAQIELAKQMLPLRIQFANAQTQAQQEGLAGNGQAGTPISQETFNQRNDPARVQVGSTAYLARNPATADTLNNKTANYNNALMGIQSLEKLGPGSLAKGSPNYGQASAVKTATKYAVAQFLNPSPSRAPSPELIEQASQMIDDPTSLKEIFEKGARNSATMKTLSDQLQQYYHQGLKGFRTDQEVLPSRQAYVSPPMSPQPAQSNQLAKR